mgnify:FL=1
MYCLYVYPDNPSLRIDLNNLDGISCEGEGTLSVSRKSAYAELVDKLKKLGLPTYEASAYVTLLSVGGPEAGNSAGHPAEDVLTESEGIRRIPRTKIHYALRELEKKRLIERVENSYPHRYVALHVENALEKLYSSRSKTLEEQLEKLNEAREEIASICSQLYHSGIWEIKSEEEAKAITREIWKEARNEILLMTEVGEWVLTTGQLTNILENKRSGFEIYVLLTGVQERIDQRRRFEEFLARIGARTYHYPTPVALRMNVVDAEKCLLFLTDRSKNGKEQEKIYFSPSPVVAYSFAELFALKCLDSCENQEKLRKALPSIDPVLSKYLYKISFLEEKLMKLLFGTKPDLLPRH